MIRHPDHKDWARDREAMRSDWQATGDDLSSEMLGIGASLGIIPTPDVIRGARRDRQRRDDFQVRVRQLGFVRGALEFFGLPVAKAKKTVK